MWLRLVRGGAGTRTHLEVAKAWKDPGLWSFAAG